MFIIYMIDRKEGQNYEKEKSTYYPRKHDNGSNVDWVWLIQEEFI